ncbi:MAG: hypothetical protein SOT34_00135 [Candidatus Borkfalkiaceae bacterium]|nr:hypothetical protein [Christensenellaceae bacterium]
MDTSAKKLLSRLKTLGDGVYRVVSYRSLTEGEDKLYDAREEIERDLLFLQRAETIELRYRDGEVFLFRTLPKAFFGEEKEENPVGEKERTVDFPRGLAFLLFLVALTGGFAGAALGVAAAVALC